MTTATKTHKFRVACAEHQATRASKAAAKRLADRLNTPISAGSCLAWHTVEQLVDGEWVALHVLRAREILAAPVGAVIDTPDGKLIKCGGTWSREAAARAEPVRDQGIDAYCAALGAHTTAELSADGRLPYLSAWCKCLTVRPTDWVRYERYSERGREGHGYVHAACRYIVQTG